MMHTKTVAVTHCYTDQNKGDAAIIQSTIQLLRASDPSLIINLYSTFGPDDPRFATEHEFIKPMANALYPAILYNPEKIKWLPHEASRGIAFLVALFQSLMLLVTVHPAWVRLFARGRRAEGIVALAKADLIISKGGSYLTSQNTSLRQAISLATMLYPFLFAIRYRRPCIIFSQSLGPVNGWWNRFLFDRILRNIDKIYVREHLCIEKYASVRKLSDKTDMEVIPDTAFFFQVPEESWVGSNAYLETIAAFDNKRLKIGITIVDHAFKYIAKQSDRERHHAAYVESIVGLIRHLRDQYDAQIHIFPQVMVGNSHKGHSDVRLSQDISDMFTRDGTSNVAFHRYDYSPLELRLLYSRMDAFVGTRLHSVIFATSTGCPAINISYHGTKSQGIFGDLAVMRDNVLQIDTITTDELIAKVDSMLANRIALRSELKKEVRFLQEKLRMAMNAVISRIHG